MRIALVAAMGLVAVGGCAGGGGGRGDSATGPSTTSPTTASTTSVTTTGTGSGSGDTSDTESFDVGLPGFGCDAIDLLFIIDNSESMETYQQELADTFPDFVDEMYAELPPAIDLHVGVTTTDFDAGCDDPEATQNCQSTASEDEILAHYIKPSDQNDGGNGTQGRLFNWSNQRYFETTTDQDSGELKTWFAGAATAAGENGCSFEMPVAAAGWVADPANAATNDGFIRDERALLVLFFLTDEPDKSPESESVYRDMILGAKTECGGGDCVFATGLVPSCTIDVNQKLWQFMGEFSDDEPPWSDIEDTPNYSALVGTVLADAVSQACAQIP